MALGREVTAACFDGLMRSYAEARCLDLTGVGGQLLLGVGSQLSEGALAELGALCPDVQTVFCPRGVRSCTAAIVSLPKARHRRVAHACRMQHSLSRHTLCSPGAA